MIRLLGLPLLPGKRRRARRALVRLATAGGPVRPARVDVRTPRLAGLLAGVAVLAVGARPLGPLAAVPAVATAAVAMRGLRRLAQRDRAERRRTAETLALPLSLDLLGACLVGGAAVDAAAVATGRAVGGPLGERFAAIGADLRAGVEPAQAWSRALAPDAAPGLSRVAQGVLRSQRDGGALEPWLAAIGTQAREEARAAAARDAARRGVLAVLPLGLCSLPAYLLLGVVPAVAGVFGRLR